MSTDLHLPELGENIDTATVVEVFVSPGDTVAVDQPLMSLETEKAEFELPSTIAGTVTEVLVAPGDQITVGQVVVRIEESGAPKAATGMGPSNEAAPAPAGGTALDASARRAVRDDSEQAAATASQRESRTRAATGQPQVPAAARDRETATGARQPGVATPRRPAPTSTAETPARPASASDDEAPAQPGPASTGKTTTGSAATSTAAFRGPIAAAPSVRRLARELGIALEAVAAAIGRNRITSQDVRAFAEGGSRHPAPEPSQAGLLAPEPLPDFSAWGPVRIEEMSKVRRRTAERLTRAWVHVPRVTHHDEADISELDRLRKKHAPRIEQAGGQLTWTVLLVKVAAAALKRFPQLNSSVDLAGARIVYKDYVHIGIAVDTERGLLVPVIRNADEKTIVELAKELREVSEGARKRNIMPDRLQGGTFTITNLGGIGGTAFSPIVNPPEVAILGVSRAAVRPVWTGKEFEPRTILPLSLSYDHRVIDGAEAARFLRWVCEAIEVPSDVLDLEES